jgi:hypothetical protein
MKGRRLRLGGVLLALASSGLAFDPGAVRSRPGADAVPWSVELTLSVRGQYRLTGRTGPVSGDYAFTVLWKGSLEPDDVDWRLVHKSCDLLDWRIEERPPTQARGEVLTEKDVPEKPVFQFRYVLQDQGLVEFDFRTEGFSVPLTPSPEKFALILPSSARTGRSGGAPNYDALLVKGSNRVVIPQDEMGTEPIEKTFAWGWAGNQSVLAPDATIVCRQTHQVRLKLVLIPRAR